MDSVVARKPSETVALDRHLHSPGHKC